MAALAEDAVGVAQNVAEGLLQPAAPSESAQSDSPSAPSGSRPPGQRDLGTTPIYQSTQYRCVPATAHTLFVNKGSPGQDQFARDMGTDRAKGTTFDVAARVIDRYYYGPDTITARTPKDSMELLSLVTTDIWRYDHGVMLGMDPALLHWPQHRHANHAVAAVGYNHNSGGYLTIIDGFHPNMSDWQWGTRRSPNGTYYGSSVPTPTSRRWYEPVRNVLGAMEGTPNGYSVVW